MAYVPPALRRKQEAAVNGKDKRSNESLRQQSFDLPAKHDSCSLRHIQKHFWPKWVPEPPVVQNLQGNSADAKSIDGRSGQPSNAIVDGSDTQSHQENASRQPGTALMEHGCSSEANFKSDKPSDISEAAQRTAQCESGELQKSPVSYSQQLEDSHPRELASGNNAIFSNNGNDTTTTRPQDALGVNLAALESVHPHNTLNSTEQNPDSLQYVLLFYDANPRWGSDQIIYVKSALELLPTAKQDETETRSSSQESLANIMIFEQQNGHRTPTSAMFKFIGYFNLVKMQMLEPQTPELVRMQEQKWTCKDRYGRTKPINRNAESWKKSLSQRWAVLGFEKDEKATEELKSPQIETSRREATDNDARKERRSVNDMLREMRMKDGS